jgi:hypothetical protein
MCTSKITKYFITFFLVIWLTGCGNALYFYETEKISLTAEARPDSSQPVQGSLGIKQRVVLIAPKKSKHDDAVSSISSFNFKTFDKEWDFNPVLIQTAFITGDAAKNLKPNEAQAAAKAITLNGIKPPNTEDTNKNTAEKIVLNTKVEADKNTLKEITEKDFMSLSDQDFQNFTRISGFDKDFLTAELHAALKKELNN